VNKHVPLSTVVPFRAPPAAREALVREMAMHLIAGTTEGLDLSSDFDVIRYLKNTAEAYPARVITAHMDDAVMESKQIIIAAVFGGR
jgi:hypothetical protein